MKAYQIYVHDRRRTAPMKLTAELAHDRRARDFAQERLASCADYEAIEVWANGDRLWAFRRNAAEAASRQAA